VFSGTVERIYLPLSQEKPMSSITPMMRALVSLALAVAIPAQGDELQVAVAANFLGTMQKLAPEFERKTGHKLFISGGASGQFYTQITQGAPFDVFLSADSERPRKLEDDGFAMAGSRFTYAVGKVVLWSPEPGVVDDHGDVLKKGDYKRLSMANPKVAPYGAAAKQVLEQLQVWGQLNADKKIVTADSIGQAYQFVASGSVDLGFVALAQVPGDSDKNAGSIWHIPQELYDPITQDVVILRRTRHQAAAVQLLQWLRADTAALATIKADGYGVE
jgi:molybdate transport system substrate-binding protein